MTCTKKSGADRRSLRCRTTPYGERTSAVRGTGCRMPGRKRAPTKETISAYCRLLDHIPQAVVVLDPKTLCFVDANDQATLLFGLERAALFHKGPIELSPRTQPDGRPSRDAALESISQAVDGATPRFVWAHQNANGDEVPCEIRLVRLGSDADPLVAGIITDLRDRERDRQEGERLRNQLELAHKMATMGLLASGVVHDLNNMLTPIVGFIELVKDDLPKRTRRREDLEEALKTFAEATELLRHLLSFIQGRMDDQPRADIARTVKESLELVRRTIPPNIKLSEQIHADSGTVSAHPAQLLQVVLNLCMNACQAMADAGGMLKITLSQVEIEPVPAAELPKLPPGSYAKLTVSDTGTGIDAEVGQHIFEPLFTTKEIGQGTGLGLAVIREIVTSHGGTIEFHSTPGRGTRFEVYLPLLGAE